MISIISIKEREIIVEIKKFDEVSALDKVFLLVEASIPLVAVASAVIGILAWAIIEHPLPV